MVSTGSLLIFTGVLVLLGNLLFLEKNDSNLKIAALLFVGSFLMRLGFYQYFPFLNLWDEQFHALVAKNLANTPLHPRLYPEAPLAYDSQDWSANHTWLHKQPWFLWQMALSIKLFGNNVLAVRLPSMVMGSVLPIFVFLIGKWHFGKRIGLFGALVMASNFFVNWLTQGMKPTDHNDVAFLFYVTASFTVFSFYAKTYYQKSNLRRDLMVVIGVLAGIAVLNKWLVGLYVFAAWGLWIMADRNLRSSGKAWIQLIGSALIAGIVFSPWQIYIHNAFPTEAAFEAAFNTKHFFEVVEGHEHPWHFFLTNLGLLFGLNEVLGGWGLMIPALAALLWSKRKLPKLFFPWIGAVAFVYLFFTIAATKMPAFPLITAPFWMLAIGALLAKIYQWLGLVSGWKKVLNPIAVIALAILILFNSSFFDYSRVRDLAKNPYFEGRLHNYAIYEQIDTLVPEGEKWVVFNTSSWEGILAMFFSKRNILVYPWIPPDEDSIQKLREQGYRLAVFDSDDLPDAFRNNPNFYIIPKAIVKHSFF
jgi:4-amino-4-deoxy-L-arabinose transferase-like glycosyltransferase